MHTLPLLALAVAALAAAPAHAQTTLQARSLAATCANCHGTDGHSVNGAIKPLAGMQADRMLALLADFRSGALPATVMHQITKGYTEDQLRQIAGYFAAQKPR